MKRKGRDKARALSHDPAFADGCAIIEGIVDRHRRRRVVNEQGEAVAGRAPEKEAAGVEQLQLELVGAVAERASLPTDQFVWQVPKFPGLRDGVGINRI